MNVTRYKCSVLAIDDAPDVLAILATQLSADFEVITATSAEQGRAVLARRSCDIVVCDLRLPDESGLDLLDWVRRTVPRAARVLLTGAARLQDAVDAINHSQVHRLVLKPWRAEDLLQTLRAIARALLLERSHEQLLDELRRLNLELEQRVHTRTLELEHALGQLQQKNQLLEKMAATDALTGLPNRRAIERIARMELQRRTRLPAPIGLILIDADHFGQVNREHTHAAGDHVLMWLAGVMQGSIRASDSLGRWAGEEFFVVAPGTDLDGAEVLAERLRANVEAAHTVYTSSGGRSHTIRMTVSLGVAVADATTPVGYEQLRDSAMEAEREAKCSGRNKVITRIVAPPPLV
jgi:diguanylate cyclase (GGDEF)-like protein